MEASPLSQIFLAISLPNRKSSGHYEMLYDELLEISKTYGSKSSDIDSTLYELSDGYMHTAYNYLVQGDYENYNSYIRKLNSIKENFGSKHARSVITFHINRIQSLYFSKIQSWVKAIRCGNDAISKCPIINECRVLGIVECIVFISDAYGALEQHDDAVQSAKLAVNVAHTQYEVFRNLKATIGETKNQINEDIFFTLGPTLDHTHLFIYSYLNLAIQLSKRGMTEASMEWHQRTLQTAEILRVDNFLLEIIQNFGRLNAFANNGLTRDVKVLTPVKIDQQVRIDNSQVHKPVSQKVNNQVPNENYKMEHAKEVFPTNNVMDVSKNQVFTKRGTSKSLHNIHFAPEDQHGSDSPGTHQFNDDEYGCGSPKRRPKSAVSKLGGRYESIAPDISQTHISNNEIEVQQNNWTSGEREQLSSINSSDNCSPGKADKQESQSADQEGKQQVCLLKQRLDNETKLLLEERIELDNLKNNLADEMHQCRNKLRRKEILQIKADNWDKKNVSKLIALNDDNQFIQSYNVLKQFSNIIQNLDPESSSDNSQYFYEGLIVEVELNPELSGKRVEGVIVRCRANGNFDVEIISSGELFLDLPQSRVKCMKQKGKQKLPSFKYVVGAYVECKSLDGNRWYAGFIDKKQQNDLFRIDYVDGSFDDAVSINRLRPHPRNYETKRLNKLYSGDLSIGSSIYMKFDHSQYWRPGIVVKIRDLNLVDVILDGNRLPDKGIPIENIRMQHPSIPMKKSVWITKPNPVTRSKLKLHSTSSSRSSPGKQKQLGLTTSAEELRQHFDKDMHDAMIQANAQNNERIVARILHNSIVRNESSRKIQKVTRGFLIRREFMRSLRLKQQENHIEASERMWINKEIDVLEKYSKLLANILKDSTIDLDADFLKLNKKSESQSSVEGHNKEIGPTNENRVSMNDVVQPDSEIGSKIFAPLKELQQEIIELQKSELSAHKSEVEEIIDKKIEKLSESIKNSIAAALSLSTNNEKPFERSIVVKRIEELEGKVNPKQLKYIPSQDENESMLAPPPISNRESYDDKDDFRLHLEEQVNRLSCLSTSIMDSIADASSRHIGLKNYGNVENLSLNVSSDVEVSILGVATLLGESSSSQNDANAQFKSSQLMITSRNPEEETGYVIQLKIGATKGHIYKITLPDSKLLELASSQLPEVIQLSETEIVNVNIHSIQLDYLCYSLHSIWDASIAWEAQKVMLFAALFECLKNILFTLTRSAFDSVDLTSGHQNWLSNRYEVFQSLFDIMQNGHVMYVKYLENQQVMENDIFNMLNNWGINESLNCSDARMLTEKICKQIIDCAASTFKESEDVFDAAKHMLSGKENVKRVDLVLQVDVSKQLALVFDEMAEILSIAPSFEDLMSKDLLYNCITSLKTTENLVNSFPWNEWYNDLSVWISNLKDGSSFICDMVIFQSKFTAIYDCVKSRIFNTVKNDEYLTTEHTPFYDDIVEMLQELCVWSISSGSSEIAV